MIDYSSSIGITILFVKGPWLLEKSSVFRLRVIKSRRLRWAGHVARMEEGRSAFIILTGKPTGKRPLRRLRRRWEDNIKIGRASCRERV